MKENNVQIISFKNYEVPDHLRIEKVCKFILKNFNSGRILDIGCCKRGFSEYLSKYGFSCIGINIIFDIAIEQVKLVCSDFNCSLPFKDESFDIITAGEVIEHSFDDNKFLRECYRVLKPGGILALTCPNISFLPNRILILLGKFPKFACAPFHYHIYTLDYITKLLKQYRFKIIKKSSTHILYSRRRHPSGIIFEILGDLFPNLGMNFIIYALKLKQ